MAEQRKKAAGGGVDLAVGDWGDLPNSSQRGKREKTQTRSKKSAGKDADADAEAEDDELDVDAPGPNQPQKQKQKQPQKPPQKPPQPQPQPAPQDHRAMWGALTQRVESLEWCLPFMVLEADVEGAAAQIGVGPPNAAPAPASAPFVRKAFDAAFELGPLLDSGSYGAVFRARKSGRHLQGAGPFPYPYAVKLFRKSYRPVPPWKRDHHALNQVRFMGRDRDAPPKAWAYFMLDVRKEAQLLKFLGGGGAPAGVAAHRQFLGVDGATVYESQFAVYLLTARFECSLSDAYDAGWFHNPFDVAYVWKQALQALAYLHANGILHLDVKPPNLMVTNTSPRVVKLIDFGMCRKTAAAAAGPRLSACQVIQPKFHGGTPGFAAPEVLDNTTIPDGRADVWSLGVSIYLITHRKMPFAKPISAASPMPDTLTPNNQDLVAKCTHGGVPLVTPHFKGALVASLLPVYTQRARAAQLLQTPLFTQHEGKAPGPRLGAKFAANAQGPHAPANFFRRGYEEEGGGRPVRGERWSSATTGGGETEHSFESRRDSDGEFKIRRLGKLHAFASHEGDAGRAPAGARHQPAVAPDHPVAREQRRLKRKRRRLRRQLRRTRRLMARAHEALQDVSA